MLERYRGTMAPERRVNHQNEIETNILAVAPFFPPAILAGGPIRSVEGLIDRLHNEFNFYVLAVNHDLGQTNILPGVHSDGWIKQKHALIRFESDNSFTVKNYRRWITESKASVIYLNTFFSPRFSLLPQMAALLNRGIRPAVVIAPRGSLMREALGLKPLKKRVYFSIYRLLGLHRKVLWHATSNEEAADLRTLFGPHITVIVASQLRANADRTVLPSLEKKVRQLRVIFLSRISPKKNLVFAIERLARINGKVHFTIAGPMEDESYAAECVALARSLPASVTVDFIGTVEHTRVEQVITDHHLFFLPSLAENYGHAIVEALYCSRPVLIGDRTPWHDLDRRGLGHDIPLVDTLAFDRALQQACDQDQEEFVRQIEAMPSAVAELLDETGALEQNRSMFRTAASGASSK